MRRLETVTRWRCQDSPTHNSGKIFLWKFDVLQRENEPQRAHKLLFRVRFNASLHSLALRQVNKWWFFHCPVLTTCSLIWQGLPFVRLVEVVNVIRFGGIKWSNTHTSGTSWLGPFFHQNSTQILSVDNDIQMHQLLLYIISLKCITFTTWQLVRVAPLESARKIFPELWVGASWHLQHVTVSNLLTHLSVTTDFLTL